MDQSVILYNTDNCLIGQISLRSAVRLMLKKKVEVIKYGDTVLYDPRLASNEHIKTHILMPKILRLLQLVKNLFGKMTQARHRKLQFNKKYVYLRDDKQCAYCPRPADTIDHIVPQSRKGQTTYENTVACCNDCNNRKKNRTPQEAGMKLLKKPYAPTHQQLKQWRQRELAEKVASFYKNMFQ